MPVSGALFDDLYNQRLATRESAATQLWGGAHKDD